MFQRIHLKFILTIAVLALALTFLYPFTDRPFNDFIKDQATANKTEFLKLMDRAAQRAQASIETNKTDPAAKKLTVYLALKQIAHDEKIDLSEFFPQVNLERSLRNIDKRNSILLDYLLKKSKGSLQLGLDLHGGVAFTLETTVKGATAVTDKAAAAGKPASKSVEEYTRQKQLEKAIEIIGTRINGLGVAEPIIRAVGQNRIEVQLPGVSTKENPEVVDALKKPARLEFHLVDPQISGVPNEPPPSMVPPGSILMSNEDEDHSTGKTITRWYAIKRVPEMTGESVTDARATMDSYGNFEILLKFDSAGAKRFGEVTGANVGRQLAIVLDDKLYSAPRINDKIAGGSAQITGQFTQREAEELANVLNNPLDVGLSVKEQNEVGPSLAQDAIDSGRRATIIGAILVCAFMITYYRAGGWIAVLTLFVNIPIILGSMAMIHATLTLPGLAGIVLTIGMAVDANILIYERMREELAVGKSLMSAHDAGYDKALWTILDAHITQLCICAIMILWGTGPIKGFGVTLAIGVFSTLFSVLISGRVVMDFLIEKGIMKRFPMMHLFSGVNLDWIKIGKPAFITSWCIVLIGVGAILLRSERMLGIDFTGGDQVTLSFSPEHQIDSGELRRVATAAGISEISPSYQADIATQKQTLKVEMPYGHSSQFVAALQKAHPEAQFDKISENAIGATVGSEIAKNATISVVLSLAAILLYIAFRFEFGFGMGAVIATLHDVLMTVGMFVLVGSFFGFQFNGPMVAAILAIIGYSVNDTVVVFDRIREELKLNPTANLRDITNLAINRVFSRSLMTSVTTFLAALGLFVFGGGVLRELAFTFLIGIVTGTFSSIGIAAQVFYWWHKGDRKHVDAHKELAPKYEWVGASRASK